MKIHFQRYVAAAASVLVASSTTAGRSSGPASPTAIFASAFTTGAAAFGRGRAGGSFVGRSLGGTKDLKKAGHVTMFFGNLFGGGGAYEAKINYDELDHPGPELADMAKANKISATSPKDPNLAIATFAGGCFWGLELAYQRVPGVVYTGVGYSQGQETDPTYSQVCSGTTGHTEAVVVYYDPRETTYEKLLDTFFDRVNPTTVNGQGNDFGRQYRTGVYYHTPEQEEIARGRFEQEQTKYKKPIASELKGAMPFWPAEKYHHQYLAKGGRFNAPQNAAKGATEEIRCYG